MSRTIIVTGASSGFGAMITRALAGAGHHVYAGMRDTVGRNAPAVRELAAYASDQGVPAEAVSVETNSRSTFENAQQIKPLVAGNPARRLVLLSSDYHMRRASAVFTRQGMTVRTVPIPDALKRSTGWSTR